MKKTIVAAAIAAAVAAPAAFAEVSISGNVYLETGDNNGEQDEVFTDLFFKASEDIGNGMTVSSKIQMVNDNLGTRTGTAAGNSGERTLSISGAFGTITGGYMEKYTEAVIMGATATDAAHTITIEGGVGNDGNMAAGKRYTSPSIQGATLILESFDAGSSTAAIEYSNSGLVVKYAQESGATDTTDVDSFLAQYTMGDLMVRVTNTEDDLGNEQTFYGATYTMGANTIGLGMIDTKAGSTADSGLVATDGDYTVSLSHAFSKSTNAYIAHFNNDDGQDETVVGVLQKF